MFQCCFCPFLCYSPFSLTLLEQLLLMMSRVKRNQVMDSPLVRIREQMRRAMP